MDDIRRSIGVVALLALGTMSGCGSHSGAVVVFHDVAGDSGLIAMDPDGRNRRRASEAETGAYGKSRRDHWSRAGSFQAIDLAWSPDGRRVAFVRRTGLFFVAEADGSGEKKVRDNARSPFFLPDGRVIFAEGLPGESIHVMDPDGGNVKVLCKPKSPGGVWLLWAISPRGDQVLYRKYESDRLYRLDLKTGAEQDLGAGRDPAWIELPGTGNQ